MESFRADRSVLLDVSIVVAVTSGACRALVDCLRQVVELILMLVRHHVQGQFGESLSAVQR